jgi:hemerythrin-like metal-binding protein
MQKPAIPPDEDSRLEMLRSLLILDTPAEQRFDLLTAYAASRFNVPIALVSLVDADRQWFKSKQGLDACQTSREISFCGHAILSDAVFVVPDATKDLRFFDNPLVTGGPKVCFYAGAPIMVKSGHRIGSFCIIDHIPHQLDEWDLEHLSQLAQIVAREIDDSFERATLKEWNPSMSVGSDILDEDHQAFFAIASLLNEMTSHGGEKIDIESSFNILKEYMAGHFLREEAAMEAAKYPAIKAHIAAHANFARSLNTLIDNYHRSVEGTIDAMARLTAEWWTNHILAVDAKYIDWIKGVQVDDRPLGYVVGGLEDGHDYGDGIEDAVKGRL